MEKLIKTAKEINRILESGIEIHPNSPIHEKLKKALNIACVSNNKVAVCPKCGNDSIYSFHGSNICLNENCNWAN